MDSPNKLKLKPIDPSCFNCKFIKRWNHPATLEDPGDEGWECGHTGRNSFNPADILEGIPPNPECPDCKGTGFVDPDTFTSIDVNAVALSGGYLNAMECSCSEETEDSLWAEHYAKECPGYRQVNWSTQSEPDEPDELTPEQIQELAEIEAEAQKAVYLQQGWITEKGELTPEFFDQAQFEYERGKGK